MSQAPLCPNLSQKVQAEVSKMANRNLSRVILLGGLSVNLNHLKTRLAGLQTGIYRAPCLSGRRHGLFKNSQKKEIVVKLSSRQIVSKFPQNLPDHIFFYLITYVSLDTVVYQML